MHEDILDRSIDVQVLRRELEADASTPLVIRAERGDVLTLPVAELLQCAIGPG